MTQQKYVTPEEFFEMFHDERIDMLGWKMISENEDDESATMLLKAGSSEKFFFQILVETSLLFSFFDFISPKNSYSWQN